MRTLFRECIVGFFLAAFYVPSLPSRTVEFGQTRFLLVVCVRVCVRALTEGLCMRNGRSNVLLVFWRVPGDGRGEREGESGEEGEVQRDDSAALRRKSCAA